MLKATQNCFGLLLAIALTATGCAQSNPSTVEGKPDELGTERDKIANGKADAWNHRNNPDGLRVEMTRVLADLPNEGETENQAWPDTYWPTYKDSAIASTARKL